ncbi:phosphoribosylamine--glycine ligase, partial [Rhizobiaceae bacterium]|nr:phosphoribosylamine--glycine ligase [Rhizobiaceae bacterium]
TLDAMVEAGTPFSGVLYAGLMIGSKGPQLIEYNVRFGDPECQVLMARITSDLVPLLLACAQGDVSGVAVEWSDRPAVGIVLAAKAYPASSEPTAIQSVPEDANGRIVFHAGTALENGGLMATGGRVLTAVASGSTFAEAQDHAYELASKIEWAGGRYRRDIGSRAVERKAG